MIYFPKRNPNELSLLIKAIKSYSSIPVSPDELLATHHCHPQENAYNPFPRWLVGAKVIFKPMNLMP
jgi:hypothetical protein